MERDGGDYGLRTPERTGGAPGPGADPVLALGAGKTTLTRALAQRPEWGLELSVSFTTRARRPSEIDGQHYRFIDRDAFEHLRERDDLLEWAEVHGNYYGTPRSPVEKAWPPAAT